MTETQCTELFCVAAVWQAYAMAGPFKDTSCARDVVIQSQKLQRMLSAPNLFPTAVDPLAGKTISKKEQKRRGKKHKAINRQYDVLKRVTEKATRAAITQPLTKAQMRVIMQKTEKGITRVAANLHRKLLSTRSVQFFFGEHGVHIRL